MRLTLKQTSGLVLEDIDMLFGKIPASQEQHPKNEKPEMGDEKIGVAQTNEIAS